MKKLIVLSSISAAAFAVFAAFDFSAAKTLPVLTAATTVNAGATNTTTVAASGLKGNAELFVTASGDASRTALNVSLWATNTVDGGWFELSAKSFTATNAGVFRVSFPAEYVSNPTQVRINSVGAASTVSAFILSH